MSTWTFLHVNDSHLGTPRSYRFRPAINQRWAAIKRQMASMGADLLLHGGDLTRDGETHEFEYRTQPAGNTAQLAERWPEADTRFGFQRGTVTEAGIDVDFVPGDDQCGEFGAFGPMGHPPVEQRDCSTAQAQPPLHPDAD